MKIKAKKTSVKVSTDNLPTSYFSPALVMGFTNNVPCMVWVSTDANSSIICAELINNSGTWVIGTQNTCPNPQNSNSPVFVSADLLPLPYVFSTLGMSFIDITGTAQLCTLPDISSSVWGYAGPSSYNTSFPPAFMNSSPLAALIVWVDSSSNNNNIVIQFGAFGNNLTTNLQAISAPQILGYNGNFYLAWIDNNNAINVCTINVGSQSVGTPWILAQSSVQPSLFIANNMLYIAWQEYNVGHLMFACLYNGNTQQPFNPVDTEMSMGSAASVIGIDNNTILVGYLSPLNNNICLTPITLP